MRWLRFAFAGVLCSCAAEDSGDDTNATFTASTLTTPGTGGDDGSSSATATADDSGTTGLTNATDDSGSSGGPATLDSGDASTSSGGAVDCAAPTDCATCWDCAAQGPCMAQYMSCQANINCIPSLTCIDSMCTPAGLAQDCTTTCCISCMDLDTCGMVDAALSCIETQCAGLCGDVTCG